MASAFMQMPPDEDRVAVAAAHARQDRLEGAAGAGRDEQPQAVIGGVAWAALMSARPAPVRRRPAVTNRLSTTQMGPP
jgi:hypothetical protein